MAENHLQVDQEKLQEWVREQYQKANQHLAEKGVLFDSVVTEDSRYLPPYLAVWKIKSMENKFYWVISGDLPSDYIAAENAATAREAIKHFSLSWHVKAQNIRENAGEEKVQLQFAALLEDRATHLFSMQENDAYWG